MKLKDQIIALNDGKRTTRQIADIVGCDTPYVRVVLRQRKGGAKSQIDLRHEEKKGKVRRQERVRRLYHSVPIEIRRKVGREAYAKTGRCDSYSAAIIAYALACRTQEPRP